MDQEPDSNIVVVVICPICQGQELEQLQVRSDGIPVVRCARCGMGFVARYPRDTGLYYADEYYYGDSGQVGQGYGDYDQIAAHSLGWVAQLLRLLRPDGLVRLLDVGCANGYLLNHAGPRFERYGIEVNASLARLCAEAGIAMIAQDIADPGLVPAYAGAFDLITAIAVLEHVPDMRGALARVRELLAPGGAFIFEVPLIAQDLDSTIWFSTSLEHIYYPTVEGLRYVCEAVFGHPPAGGAVDIRGYGPTFVGLIAADERTQLSLQSAYDRLFCADPATLGDPEERLFRFLFDVIHAAHREHADVSLLAQIDPAALTPPLLARIAELWHAGLADQSALTWLQDDRDRWQREAGLAQKQAGEWQSVAEQYEAARDYHARQTSEWQSVAKQYEEARDYHAQQAANWQRVADAYEEARDYHAQQAAIWQQAAEERAAEVARLEAALAERRTPWVVRAFGRRRVRARR